MQLRYTSTTTIYPLKFIFSHKLKYLCDSVNIRNANGGDSVPIFLYSNGFQPRLSKGATGVPFTVTVKYMYT